MTKKLSSHDEVLEAISREIDIPEHLDELARNRYKSVGEWLDRTGSSIKKYSPEVYPQGSFALGTVIRPIATDESYDLDLVCRLAGTKDAVTMAALKQATGVEVRAYAQAHSMKHDPEDKRRCWTMEYADEANFHADILPALPDETAYRDFLRERGHVNLANNEAVAAHALAITDKTHQAYNQITQDWPVSNPKGFATWFHSRHAAALARAKDARFATDRAYASVDDIPNYRVKTPLQRAIQLLKRHRDTMFMDDAEHKPISVIITTLSAHAYSDEQTISEAIRTILREMHSRVEFRGNTVWIANPTNPEENFADKWVEAPEKKLNFFKWLDAARRDFGGYIREGRFDQIPRDLAERLGRPEIAKVTKEIGLAIPAVAAVAAGQAEAESIKATGAETRPWAE